MKTCEALSCKAGGGGRYAHRAAGIESEPADPEDEDAQRGDGQIVPEDGPGFPVLVFPDARADQRRPYGRQPSAHGVHYGRPGEVVEAQSGQPAAAPGQCPASR